MSSSSYSNADAFSFARTIAGPQSGMEQDAASATRAQADLTSKAAQAGKDLVVFSRGNMEAVAQASQVFAAGSQDLVRQMAEAGQAAMNEALTGMKAITAAKTPKAMVELQATFLRTSAIQAITEAARIAQSGVDLAERVSAPVVARMTAAAEMMTADRS